MTIACSRLRTRPFSRTVATIFAVLVVTAVATLPTPTSAQRLEAAADDVESIDAIVEAVAA